MGIMNEKRSPLRCLHVWRKKFRRYFTRLNNNNNSLPRRHSTAICGYANCVWYFIKLISFPSQHRRRLFTFPGWRKKSSQCFLGQHKCVSNAFHCFPSSDETVFTWLSSARGRVQGENGQRIKIKIVKTNSTRGKINILVRSEMDGH